MSNDLLFSIGPYREKFDKQIVDLILHIQNDEAKLDISAADQPDITSIQSSYIDDGGDFGSRMTALQWWALSVSKGSILPLAY